MRVQSTDRVIEACDAAFIAVISRRNGSPAFEALNAATGGALAAQAEEEAFDGAEGRSLEWRGELGGAVRRVVAVGVGDKPADAAQIREAVARAYAAAVRFRVETAAVYLDSEDEGAMARRVGAAVEGLHLARYRFDAYRSKRKDRSEPKRFSVGVHGAARGRRSTALKAEVGRATGRAGAVVLCRDLVNEPANALGPEEFAARARRIARDRGLTCRVFGEEELRRRGMRLILSVSAGSNAPPRLVHLTYAPPKRRPARRIALVGKGVTFDSGGLCLKPAKSMADMKTDMAGGALVLACLAAAAELRLDAEIHGLVPLAENGVGPGAPRPGDIVEGYSGTTVEIVNTDCEGRLLLADALAYACELDVDEIVDFATLTGACPVSLGPHRAGLLTADDDLAARFEAAATRAGELVWRLPLAEELERDIRSDVADVKNQGGRYGGTITAALFLKRFVKPSVPWLHLDIAGPARAESPTPLCPRGGSGYGVLSCLEFLSGEPGDRG